MRLVPLYFLLLLGVVLVFYFSWLPNPRLSTYGYLPEWLATWVDDIANMNLRTAVPFVFLGLLTGSWLTITKQAWGWWLTAWLGLVGVVVVAEVGQLFESNRHFDWGDIIWGGSGALGGMIMFIPVAIYHLSSSNENSDSRY